MYTLPNRLRLVDGELEMIDGSDLKGYLGGHPTIYDTDVVVMRRDVAQAAAGKVRAERAEERRKILGALADQEDATLKGMSADQLRKRLEDLDNAA